MKIKCPACASLLQIPDSAAGKVVKCKCGKQMRAPVPKGAAPAAQQPQSAPAAAPTTPAQSTPAPYNPFADTKPAPTGGIFDELTDTDLAPIKAVAQPGAKAKVAPPNANAAKLLDEAISGSDNRPSARSGPQAPRPGFLTFIGVMNGIYAIVMFLLAFAMIGLLAVLPAIADEVQQEEGTSLYLAVGVLTLLGVLGIATCAAVFIPKKASWYLILFSYGWGMADRIAGVIGDAMDEDVELRIGKVIGGILVGAGVWAFVHGDDVRAYFNTKSEAIGKVVAADVCGFLAGGILGGTYIFMA